MPDPKRPATPDDHASHDLLLVAEAADRGGSLPPAVADCTDCIALHAELAAIAAAVPSASIPVRPRDFTLTEADARRLRAPAWRRWLAGLGTPRDTVSRPLAIGLTTLGLAGLLMATIPGTIPGLGGATSQDSLSVVGAPAGGAAASAAPLLEAPAAEGAPDVAGAEVSAAAAPTTEGGAVAPPEAAASPGTEEQLFSGAEGTNGTQDTSQRSSTGDAEAATGSDDIATITSTDGPSPLLIAAGACLLLGLGLFGLRWSARRSGEG
jgi:hypothetical protein